MEFFNRVSGTLDIELTQPAEQITPNLYNLKAPPIAQIRSLRLRAQVYERHDFRDLTPEEYDRVALREPVIRLRGKSGEAIEHRAPNDRHFTVRDLLSAVEETERRTRAHSEWFGGIDVHHIFFEGIYDEGNGTWSIRWGS